MLLQGPHEERGQTLQRPDIPLETLLRQDRGGLGVPGGAGRHHGHGQLRDGHRHRDVRPRPALAGGGPAPERLTPVPGLGLAPRPPHPLRRGLRAPRGAPGHRLRDTRDESDIEGSRAQGVSHVQVSNGFNGLIR